MFKKNFLLYLFSILWTLIVGFKGRRIKVRRYTRGDGTSVRSHSRRAPNRNDFFVYLGIVSVIFLPEIFRSSGIRDIQAVIDRILHK